MSTPRFDLVEMTRTIHKKQRFILTITLVCAILGAIFFLVSDRRYEAKTEFVVSNPMFADRSYIFRSTEPRYIDYFAGEDDIDHVMAIANSDMVKQAVIEDAGLYEVYKLNPADKKDREKMSGIWKRNYEVTRTEYKNVELAYTDVDGERAAQVARKAIGIIEKRYRNYYNTIKNKIYASLEHKVAESDSAISSLTDTLASLRDQFQVYDIISPSRNNMISGGIKSNGKSDFGRGVELIQNIESVKDQYVMDRAKNISLLNEFSTGTQLNDLSFIQVITEPSAPVKPAGLGLVLTVLACALFGFFISVLLALMNAYFRSLTH